MSRPRTVGLMILKTFGTLYWKQNNHGRLTKLNGYVTLLNTLVLVPRQINFDAADSVLVPSQHRLIKTHKSKNFSDEALGGKLGGKYFKL